MIKIWINHTIGGIISSVGGIVMLQKMIYGHQGDNQTNYDAIRYSILVTGIAIVHFVFMVMFFIMGVMPMCIYNVVIVISYFVLSRNMTNIKYYTFIYFMILFEVVLHSSLATLFVGYDFGFMYYLIALIPVSFYLAFSISTFKRQLKYPFVSSGIVFAVIMITRIFVFFRDPVYTDIPLFYQVFLSYMNIIIGIFTTFIFSALFAIEVNSMQLILEQENEKLEDQASYDPLTHFLNRRSMDEKLTHAHRNAIINDVPYTLIMGDIDHFKQFNDTYGHDCGDYVLQTISKIISTQIRAKDSACRWGGEEFLILISDSENIAVEVANRIRGAIDNNEFYYDGKTLHVTMTLGVSGYYSSSKVKTLIEIADKRLYKGKENGRNQVVSS